MTPDYIRIETVAAGGCWAGVVPPPVIQHAHVAPARELAIALFIVFTLGIVIGRITANRGTLRVSG